MRDSALRSFGSSSFKRSPKVGNPRASILKRNVWEIPALFGLNPVSNFMGFTVGFQGYWRFGLWVDHGIFKRQVQGICAMPQVMPEMFNVYLKMHSEMEGQDFELQHQRAKLLGWRVCSRWMPARLTSLRSWESFSGVPVCVCVSCLLSAGKEWISSCQSPRLFSLSLSLCVSLSLSLSAFS